MKNRCYNPNYVLFHRYGGRGISVCERWRYSYLSFKEDMFASYKEGLSLDRVNNDGNYEPSNCRWATNFQQARNKSINHLIQTEWGLITLEEAAEKSGISRKTITSRINYGWLESDLLLPTRKLSKELLNTPWGLLNIKESAAKLGVPPSTLQTRMARWPEDKWFDPIEPKYIKVRGVSRRKVNHPE